MKRILLIRHGESEGNVDPTLYRRVADNAIDLSEEGVAQAMRARVALNTWLAENPQSQGFDERPNLNRYRVWNSPYARARQTADTIVRGLDPKHVIDRRENLLLVEQQFGALNGIASESTRDHFPHIADDYDRCLASEGRLYARPWGGESRFDVAVRVHQSFGTFHRDCDRHGIDNIIVVCHGTTLRCFVMMWLHLSPEWLNAEPNPKNCGIRLIEGKQDKGYIYKGE